MPETLMLAELTFTSEFANNVYSYDVPDVQFQLVAGETYRITWGGDEFTCEGQDGSALMDGLVLVGNALSFGLSGNDEPFALAIFSGALSINCLTDTEPTEHTVVIYRVEEERPKITLYNRATGEETFETTVLRVPTTDGGTRDFVEGTPVEKTVKLDFSGGDMVLTPEAGQLFEKVNIPVPANLTPENIAEGMDIAGIVGSMVSGGNIVVASGTFTPASSVNGTVTVPHNLGVVPDVVILYTAAKCNTSAKSTMQQYCGFSNAFTEATGNKFCYMFTTMKATSTALSAFTYSVYSGYAITGTIDSTSLAGISRVHSANTESFLVADGANGMYLVPNATYNWIAIGGLTSSLKEETI